MKDLGKHFFIIGTNAGKTGQWHGKVFIQGVWEFKGQIRDLGIIAQILGEYYAAFPYTEARQRQPGLFEKEGVYYGYDQISGSGDVSSGWKRSSSETASQSLGSTETKTLSEREISDVRDGSERSEADDFDEFLGADSSEGGDAPDTLEASPKDEAEVNVVDLASAIADLDPESSHHWTSNGLPSLEFLADRTGLKVGRLEVNRTAPGYNRSAARRAKALEGVTSIV